MSLQYGLANAPIFLIFGIDSNEIVFFFED